MLYRKLVDIIHEHEQCQVVGSMRELSLIARNRRGKRIGTTAGPLRRAMDDRRIDKLLFRAVLPGGDASATEAAGT